jgi:3-oxoacyl-[acyl-carrier protein] reductase
MSSLDNKVAVVTGGSRGIGRAIAVKLAAQGAKVVINYNKGESEAQEVADYIKAQGGEAQIVQADIAITAEAARLVDTVVKSMGRLDILVNNAGITRDKLLLQMNEADWDAVLNTNLKGVYNCSKAVLRTMLKQKAGRVINITSVSGLAGSGGQSNYSAAKAGIIGFTKALAREVASRSITVNAVAPGFIETDMTNVLAPEFKQKILAQIPLERFGKAEDIAEAVAFLAGDAGAYITGHVLTVDGGMTMM